MKVTLRKIDRTNWEECINLKVGPTQSGFILPNVNSLAEWSVTPEAHAYGIYADQTMVGFAMFQMDEEKIYDIHRFMIDFDHQCKGYGLKGIQLILNKIKELPDAGNRIKIMFLVENMEAEKLYLKAGFTDSGRTLYNSQWRFTEKIFYYQI